MISEFRPISLCNVIVRIISKVLANRMKSLMNQLISENQSAFIPGRLITDNVMIAFEVHHFIRTSQSRRKAFASIKLDMSKAYDRIEWSYLEAILRAIGFPERWISLIMHGDIVFLWDYVSRFRSVSV